MEDLRPILEALQAALLPKEEKRPTFSGDPLEDPEQFLAELEATFPTDISADQKQKLAAAQKQLRGAVATWWEPYADFQPTYEGFTKLFLEQYGGIERTMQISAQYYGQQQSNNETALDFLRLKVRQAARLKVSPADHLPMYLQMLLPKVRLAIRYPPPTTVLELLQRAETAERDLLEAAPKRSQVKPAEPAREAGPSSRPTNQLPRCQFCPERHFHRHCPVLNGSGNDPLAGPAANVRSQN